MYYIINHSKTLHYRLFCIVLIVDFDWTPRLYSETLYSRIHFVSLILIGRHIITVKPCTSAFILYRWFWLEATSLQWNLVLTHSFCIVDFDWTPHHYSETLYLRIHLVSLILIGRHIITVKPCTYAFILYRWFWLDATPLQWNIVLMHIMFTPSVPLYIFINLPLSSLL